MAFLLNGKPLPLDKAFSTGGYNYPANWLRHTTLEEKKAIGITEVTESTDTTDYRFYVSAGVPKELEDKNTTDSEGNLLKDENGNQLITKGLKTIWIQKQKAEANSMLDKYDWQVTRKAEKGTAMDAKVVTYRDSLRTVCGTRETEITNCADVAALQTLLEIKYDNDGKKIGGLTSWPLDPYDETDFHPY